jgi:GR25 family glycosyltransferase involved in LPS biosynthesis
VHGVPASSVPPSSQLILVINLERRPDRVAALLKLKLPFEWSRLDAVDGRALSWSALASGGGSPYAGLVHADAVREAQFAEQRGLPTICRSTGSFSPHLTLGAVGIALSQRKCWQTLLEARGPEFALVLEDDISSVAPQFVAKVAKLMRMLPSTWQLCFLGYHESSGKLLSASAEPRVMELPAGACVTGLYGYLIHKRGARTLLADNALFPLRHQVDVAVSQLAWPRGARFAVDPAAVLLTSPKSEEGKCTVPQHRTH